MSRLRIGIAVLVFVLIGGFGRAGTLDDIQSAGALHCGVDESVPGFSATRRGTRVQGLAPDFCRAVAVAIIGDANKAVFSVLKPEEQVEALQSGEIDLLISASPMSAKQEIDNGLLFVGPLYFEDAEGATRSFGPFVRQSDAQWLLSVQAVRSFLIRAEANAGETLLTGLPGAGEKVLAVTGHYGAMFARNFGEDIARGKNQPVNTGGWLWAPDP